MSKHYKQEHLKLQPPTSSMVSFRSSCNNIGPNSTNNSILISVDNATFSALSISTISKSNQSQLTSSVSQTVDIITMNQLHGKFNYFNNHQNQIYFFLDKFYPPHGGARGIACSAIMQSANNAYNVSTLDETQFLFKSYKLITNYLSKHCGNLMEILKSTVKYSNVNNSVIPRFPIHDKDIYKILIGSKHLIQANLPTPTTFNIINTACISLDSYIDHVLAHGIPITFAHDSVTGQNYDGLHGTEQCQRVDNSILASSPDPKTPPSLQVTCGLTGFLVAMLGNGIALYGP